ncbi:unnamed protein product [Dracunculus medinensis]|uniref:CBM21 domain-containing protein n=1 Tax=Dracunculus medinensis TaxID=318479 RepID=A0A0N4UF94_DRAME|nr:unnamed protein product [Dracunculus medinensis]
MDEIPFCITFETSFDPFKSVFGSVIATKNRLFNNKKNGKILLRSKSERSSPTRKSSYVKKIVRFSDLEQAEYVSAQTSARENICNDGNPASEALCKFFWLPNENELRWLTSERYVHLESVRWFGRAITGVVRVKNVAYEKKVEIKYTYDDWKTFQSTYGAYSGSPLSSQDQFSFCIFLPYLLFDLQVFFCIRYEAAGAVHWDSNGGANYKLYCKPIAPSNRNPFFDTDCSIFF